MFNAISYEEAEVLVPCARPGVLSNSSGAYGVLRNMFISLCLTAFGYPSSGDARHVSYLSATVFAWFRGRATVRYAQTFPQEGLDASPEQFRSSSESLVVR